jgi:O-antigen ligase
VALDLTIPADPSSLGAHDSRAFQAIAIATERSGEAGQTVLIAGLSALLIFAVLAFGSFDLWAIDIVEIGCALLFLVWIWPQISSGCLQLRANALYAPVTVFGLLIVAQVVFGLSAYVHATRGELWKYAAYGVLLLLASQCQRAYAQKLLTILAVFGFLVALFALVQDLSSNGKIYWFWPEVSGRIFGPYANNSHYAGLMEMLTPIPFAMALTDGAKRHLQLLSMVAGVLMAATIFICGSRGGMIAFVVQMIFLAGFAVTRWSRRAGWTLAALCLLTGSLALWIDDGRMLKQLDSLRDPLTNADLTSRLTIARDSLAMVRARPIAGWGLGLFPIAYPQYRSFSTDLLVNQAHDDYVQVLVETGIVGFACVAWFIVNLYRSGIQNLRGHSKTAAMRVLAPLVGCTGILVHSFSDFNLHVPANAALFFVLCGIATGRQSTDQDVRDWTHQDIPTILLTPNFNVSELK